MNSVSALRGNAVYRKLSGLTAAVHVQVVHVGQVFLAQRRAGVIGHIGGGDAGYKRGRHGGLGGGR